jgi:hypothetical protein
MGYIQTSKGDWIEIDESKKYTLNYDTMKDIFNYVGLVGKMAQKLYYQYSDTELFCDQNYDALVKIVTKLEDIYPEFPILSEFHRRVGR